MGLSKSEYDYIMEPTNGNPLLKIFQTTVAIGDLKYSIESIDPESPEPIPYEAMLQKAYEIQGILMELYHDGQLGKEPHRSAERRSDNMGIFPPELLFGYAYDFSSPNHALLFIMFWTNLVLLQPLVRRADSLFRLHTHAAGMRISPYPKFEDLARVDPEKYANKLARAMVYCLQDHIKLSLGKVMVFTLCIMSLNYVDTGNRVKHDWCLAGIMDIGFRGFDLPPYLTKLMSAQWDRRWTAGDPNITVSLREIDYSVCVLDPETVPDSTSGMEDGSMYHINDPRPVKEIFD